MEWLKPKLLTLRMIILKRFKLSTRTKLQQEEKAAKVPKRVRSIQKRMMMNMISMKIDMKYND